jgi:hypothetical protein
MGDYPEQTVKNNIRLIEEIMDEKQTSPNHRVSIVRKIPQPRTTADLAEKRHGQMQKHLKMQRHERENKKQRLKTIVEEQGEKGA